MSYTRLNHWDALKESNTDGELSSNSPSIHRKNSIFDLPPIVVDEEVMNDLKAVIAGEKAECEIDEPIIVDDDVFQALKDEIGEDKRCHMCCGDVSRNSRMV